MLELGCGRSPFQADSVRVDRVPLRGEDGRIIPDIVADLERLPWTWAGDGSCRFIIAHQTLEHIRDLIGVMNEIWRIAEADAWLEVIVPYYLSPTAYQDPMHVRFFTEMTFRYWEPDFVEAFSDYGIKGHFGLAGQRWRPDGNLWALLRPIKTLTDELIFRHWKELDEGLQQPCPFSAAIPAELLNRPDQYDFLGLNEG